MRNYAEVILEFGNRYHNGLVDLVLNIHICYDKIGILYVGFYSKIGIVLVILL